MRFFAVFALVALAEMATFFWVESKIGLIWALGLALVTALVGSFLVRRAGLSVISRLQSKVGQGQLPGRELGNGAAILASGAFLISPGFITDVQGVPPVDSTGSLCGLSHGFETAFSPDDRIRGQSSNNARGLARCG